MEATLWIDGVCSVRWWMTGQIFDSALSRYTMHAVVIEPPECYRCFSCGLCGDFKRAMTGDAAQALETCHGGEVMFEPGYTGDNAFAYDRYGNSWEYTYRRRECPVPRSELEVVATTEPAEPIVFVPEPPPDFEWVDPCDSAIAEMVSVQCQRARDLMASCCHSIGGGFCGTKCLSFCHLLTRSVSVFGEQTNCRDRVITMFASQRTATPR